MRDASCLPARGHGAVTALLGGNKAARLLLLRCPPGGMSPQPRTAPAPCTCAKGLAVYLCTARRFGSRPARFTSLCRRFIDLRRPSQARLCPWPQHNNKRPRTNQDLRKKYINICESSNPQLLPWFFPVAPKQPPWPHANKARMPLPPQSLRPCAIIIGLLPLDCCTVGLVRRVVLARMPCTIAGCRYTIHTHVRECFSFMCFALRTASASLGFGASVRARAQVRHAVMPSKRGRNQSTGRGVCSRPQI